MDINSFLQSSTLFQYLVSIQKLVVQVQTGGWWLPFLIAIFKFIFGIVQMKSLIVIGPSGVGKSTIIKTLIKKYDVFQFVISYTTRPPRIDETDGLHYYFVNYQNFVRRQKNNQLLQAKKVFNNYYGTSKTSYMGILNRKKIPLLDVDIEGMLEIKSSLAQQRLRCSDLVEPEVLCILPPTWHILRQRLKKRATENQQIVEQRMAENRSQVAGMIELKGQNGISFVTNYQYQLTVYGIEIFLAEKFQQFNRTFGKNQQYKIGEGQACIQNKDA